MSRISSGVYRIDSLMEGGAPASVGLEMLPFQRVCLGRQVTEWRVEEKGDNIYHLSIAGYRFTGVLEEEVTASTIPPHNVEWIVTYREFQEAYTIQPVNDETKGWTVPSLGEESPAIKTRLLVATQSLPPRFLDTQLFRFVPANE